MYTGLTTIIGVFLLSLVANNLKLSSTLHLSKVVNFGPRNNTNVTDHENISTIEAIDQSQRLKNEIPIQSLPQGSNITDKVDKSRAKRNLFNYQDGNQEYEITVSRKPAIYGIRCDTCEVNEEGAIIVQAHHSTRIYLIGRNLYSNLSIALTSFEGASQDDCTHNDRIKSFQLLSKKNLNVAEIDINLPSPGKTIPYYFCIRENIENNGWFHQGTDNWLKLFVEQDIIPGYAKLIIVALLLSLSGTFSGLNLGLMSLDKNDLQVIMKCGSDNEKRYAKIIEPVRARGNYLLCSILFANTLVNSTISVLLEDLSTGFIAIITSTVLIVMFGEILPQAFCSRYGLAVGAKTVYLTKFCMIITFPLSWPVSRCLDLALGEEIGHAYDRERLMEFINLTRDYNKLETDEVNIISGALKIKRVQIREVMTKIEDVYMLDESALLDYATIQSIVEKGYSRIPIHETGNKNNIVAVLFAKDLALVDPDDKTPIKSMISFYNHPKMCVFEDTTLDKALNLFKSGTSHMAIVQRIINDGERDPFYEITGIVTLEDVIEEIMQMEINDETDMLTDNRRKRRRKEAQVRKDFSHFTNLGTGDTSYNVVTPQLCLAAYQFLATTVEPFKPKYLSDTVLKRLLSQKIFYKVKVEDDAPAKRLYSSGQPADYFIMILEGRVHVTCGKENLFFDGGPFSFFGKAALLAPNGEPFSDQNLDSPIINLDTPVPSSTREPVIAKPTRKESITKSLTGHLSLSMKKLSDQQINPADQSSDSFSTALILTEVSPGSTVALAGKVSNFIIPDYTVDVIANTSYMKITTNDYVTSLRATALERSVVDAQSEEYNQPKGWPLAPF